MRLDEAITFGFVHQQSVLDLDVELSAGEGLKGVARVVCVPFEGEDRYYLTTLPRDVFSAHDVAELYRIRWEVELLFRSWKGAMRLDEVKRLSHPESLVTVVYAALCASLLNRDIHQRLERLSAQALPPPDARPTSTSRAAFPPSARSLAAAVGR